MTRRLVRRLVSAWPGAFAVVVLASCAPVPAPTTTSAPPQGPSGSVGTTVTQHQPPANRPAPIDSTPSADAQKVLATIPEPLPPGERVPPPAGFRPTVVDTPASAPSDADTTSAPLDTLSGDVPIPSPTQPLGDRPGATSSGDVSGSPSTSSAAPSAGAASPAAPSSGKKAAAGAAATPPVAGSRSTSARPDTCWRVQVAAPTDKDEAEKKRDAASSILLVPMTIETEKGRYKVRSTDCMPRDVAERLKGRAVDSGLDGAFLMVVVNKR